MKLITYAGNLFNPDRFPFLEGRKAGTTWRTTPATPLPVNNRTVLPLLRSLQYLQMPGEVRSLSSSNVGGRGWMTQGRSGPGRCHGCRDRREPCAGATIPSPAPTVTAIPGIG
jgi:hypothetical protein